MNQLKKYEAFKALHERPGVYVIPNPWNGGTARMLTSLGYDALTTTSAGYAFSAGRRDSAGAIIREQILANAREIVEATHLSVSADLEGGFRDDPKTCGETVKLASQIGLVGGSIKMPRGIMETRFMSLS
jgi:2-methylisocitrate lyase-like PEP mutase family enzyme